MRPAAARSGRSASPRCTPPESARGGRPRFASWGTPRSEVAMLGQRALEVLDSLVSGRAEGVDEAELDELVALGLVTAADPADLATARRVEAVCARHGATTPRLRVALQTLEE